MPERPDLRHIAVSLREALDGLEREALIDVLTYVLNEYVVEGPPPLAPGQVERLEDLAGLDLAGLISALQLRLDTPGLDLFRIEAGEVRVQTPSGWVALQPGRPGASPPVMSGPATPAPQPPRAAAPQAQPAAGQGRAGATFDERPMPAPPRPEPTGRPAADEAVSRGRGDLIGGERGPITPPPPRPRGLSVTGRATSGGAPAERPPAAPPPAQQPPPQQQGQQPPAAPPQQGQSPQQPGGEKSEDDASIRFSLLELD